MVGSALAISFAERADRRSLSGCLREWRKARSSDPGGQSFPRVVLAVRKGLESKENGGGGGNHTGPRTKRIHSPILKRPAFGTPKCTPKRTTLRAGETVGSPPSPPRRASANPPPHAQPREAEGEQERNGGFGDEIGRPPGDVIPSRAIGEPRLLTAVRIHRARSSVISQCEWRGLDVRGHLPARVRIGRAQSARFLVDPAICIPTSLAIRIATKSCPVMACPEASIWVAGELGTTSP